VSHSVGGIAGLFDGTDYSCTIIDDAVFNHSIIWVNAAGKVEGAGFIAPYNGTYYIAIGNYSATRPVHFELYSGYHDVGCKVENSSLCVEATAFGAKAVGAVGWIDCSTLHSYSSRGPTNDGRIKPDFVGPACVSTHSYLSVGYPFCGTSAATPHIAGAIALELSSM